jgi:hypothetical protein
MPEAALEIGIAEKFAPLLRKAIYSNVALALATGRGHHAEPIGSCQDRRRL